METKQTNKEESKPKKIAVIRIRGLVALNSKVKDTFDMLRLYRKHYCVIYNSTPSILGMIKKIKDILIPTTKIDRNHIYHLYTLKIDDSYHLTRDELIQKLHKNGIGSSVQYYPLHLMSYNRKKYGSKSKQFPIANTLKDQVLCLPIFPQMSEKQLNYVVSKLK